MSAEEQWVEAIDEMGREWWQGMNKRLKETPPLGYEKVDDREFYERHKRKAEEWQAQGDPNYIAALATVAPQELERFVKIAREVAAEEALRTYGN